MSPAESIAFRIFSNLPPDLYALLYHDIHLATCGYDDNLKDLEKALRAYLPKLSKKEKP